MLWRRYIQYEISNPQNVDTLTLKVLYMLCRAHFSLDRLGGGGHFHAFVDGFVRGVDSEANG